MKCRIPLPVVLFGLSVAPFLFAASGSAQMNGSAAASAGFGGHSVTGTVPSAVVPVQPFTGPIPPANSLSRSGRTSGSTPTFPVLNQPHSGAAHHHHRRDGGYLSPYAFGVPVPYAFGSDSANNYDDYADANSENSDDSDEEYQGGPTVFDRRGSGADSYVPPVSDVPTPHSSRYADSSTDTPQKPTLLIFKDGHKLEVGNYAIVGDTLFDLTPGHRRKVLLTELDLDATRVQNEDQGVLFSVPPQGN